jgi:hypothetical protein
MSTELRSSVDIDGGRDQVWQVLTDLAAYPDWNPFITRADGAVAVGERLSLDMHPVGARPATLHPTVLEVTPGRRLRWRGRLAIPGLFDAEHRFTVSDRRGSGVRLVQEERFTGVLAPFLAGSLNRHTLPAFDAMNKALKQRVEQAPVSQPD